MLTREPAPIAPIAAVDGRGRAFTCAQIHPRGPLATPCRVMRRTAPDRPRDAPGGHDPG